MLKVALRTNEVLAMPGTEFTTWSPVYTLDQEGVPLLEFSIPRLKSFLKEEEEAGQASTEIKEIEAFTATDPRDPGGGVAAELYAQRQLNSHLTAAESDGDF